jgi:hypothetical protein
MYMEYVTVLTAGNKAEAEMYRGVLKQEGIESVIVQDTQSGALRAAYGGASLPFEQWFIKVPIADIGKAKGILPERTAPIRVPHSSTVRLFGGVILVLFALGIIFAIFEMFIYFNR